ncbi:MAG: DNA mismatch repair endonuclease MutL, partial [Caldilineae bacterium]
MPNEQEQNAGEGGTPPPIRPLPPELTALIAAGEVVERPASVVKELLENALDAGAKAISVTVRDGGLSLIRVSDDGHGMPRADAPLAPQSFTTAKIRTPSDLHAIRTYGFRGEALSSIAAVARLEILTRAAGELEGTRVTAHGGEIAVAPAASPVGTSVTVSELFAAHPARRKFLKSPLRELELVQQTVIRYALAHPGVAFRLVADDRPRLTLPPGSALERLGAVFGRDVAAEMTPVAWEALDLRVRGYVSPPSLSRSRRDRQSFFVNRRPVRAGLLAVMLERPYAGRLPPGRYPLAVLHIEVEPAFVDVNVHPQKAEVRFSAERRIYTAVSQAVGEALAGFPASVDVAGAAGLVWPFEGVEQPFSLHEQPLPLTTPLRPLAQIHHTYLLAEWEGGVLVIDQHAAHEQVLYERLTAAPA